MNCPYCHRWAPPDPETGYDADELCPACVRDGWSLEPNGELIYERPPARVPVVEDVDPDADAALEALATGAEEERPTGADAWEGGFAKNH